ncbi:twin-arginine translocation signal domain-containing protein, partial [bacterium]|nr:twin-arginine translocation signal domain-containing protein [bacterium]
RDFLKGSSSTGGCALPADSKTTGFEHREVRT